MSHGKCRPAGWTRRREEGECGVRAAAAVGRVWRGGRHSEKSPGSWQLAPQLRRASPGGPASRSAGVTGGHGLKWNASQREKHGHQGRSQEQKDGHDTDATFTPWCASDPAWVRGPQVTNPYFMHSGAEAPWAIRSKTVALEQSYELRSSRLKGLIRLGTTGARPFPATWEGTCARHTCGMPAGCEQVA